MMITIVIIIIIIIIITIIVIMIIIIIIIIIMSNPAVKAHLVQHFFSSKFIISLSFSLFFLSFPPLP